jgi:hypothetical protein
MFKTGYFASDKSLQRHRIVFCLIKRLRLEGSSFLSDPNSITNPNAVTFDLDHDHTHIRVNENDVGLMVLIATAHAHVRHHEPVAEERASKGIDDYALGFVLQ